MSQVTYTDLVKSVATAVNTALGSVNKWNIAGRDVSAFYPNQEALEAVKAQFIADAIIPGLDKRHAAALALELPRKGSKEYNEMSEANREKWEVANQAKKDARATAHTMFTRIVSYAWPKEKTPSAPRDLKTRFNEELSALIKACEKSEDAPFDVVKVKALLENALTLVNK
jgi:hypothetical protein